MEVSSIEISCLIYAGMIPRKHVFEVLRPYVCTYSDCDFLITFLRTETSGTDTKQLIIAWNGSAILRNIRNTRNNQNFWRTWSVITTWISVLVRSPCWMTCFDSRYGLTKANAIYACVVLLNWEAMSLAICSKLLSLLYLESTKLPVAERRSLTHCRLKVMIARRSDRDLVIDTLILVAQVPGPTTILFGIS